MEAGEEGGHASGQERADGDGPFTMRNVVRVAAVVAAVGGASLGARRLLGSRDAEREEEQPQAEKARETARDGEREATRHSATTTDQARETPTGEEDDLATVLRKAVLDVAVAAATAAADVLARSDDEGTEPTRKEDRAASER